ncbi:MAG: DUF4340 domain-containing protein [Melioribacteraceae bacterium]|nr:DUF4340 domain-containing protein [Melioribacteraceae bacterium]
MFNKNSNKTLWIIFAILLVAVVLIFTTESTKKERSFKKDLVSVDTSAITSISIFPKSKPGQEVRLLKNDGNWKVFAENGKSYTVPNFKMKSFFGELTKIKPKRVAARSKAKWAEYEVDSAATRVVVNESGNEVLNLVIGKFAFQQPRSMSTFVRLMNDEDVYEVDGFLEMTFNKDAKSLRNETIVKSDKNNWSKLSFTSNVADNFELVKVDDVWMIDGIKTDSAKTATALSSLARISNTDYVDDVKEGLLPPQDSKLVIHLNDGGSIEVIGYRNESKFIVQSSQNIENYFDGNKVGEKIFLSKDSFL